MLGIPNDAPWMEDAKCGNDEALRQWQKENRDRDFFGDRGNKGKAQAIAYCNSGCEVRERCLEYAIKNKLDGIWGGTTVRQRHKLTQKRIQVRTDVVEFLRRLQVQPPDEIDPNAFSDHVAG